MGAIFLSYRRDDAEGQAGRLYDDLAAVFGPEAVFMDVTAIKPGLDFRKVIEQSLTSCGVFLILIGKNWVTAKDESGRYRLEDPSDFVRIEVAAALKRDIPVIPVLVQGATVPKREQLSEDLKDLVFRNAIELSHPRWDSDVQVLINALRPLVSTDFPKPEPQPIPRKPLNFKMIGMAALAIVMVLLAIFYPRASKKAAVNETATETERTPANEATDTTAGKLGAAAHAPPSKLAVTNTATKSVPSHPSGAELNAPAKIAPSQANEAPRINQFSLAAQQKPLSDNPNRYKFGVWLKAPGTFVDGISRVHYDFVYGPNPLSIEGAPDPPFGATYEGWGCYETVDVTVYLKSGSQPIKKTFDMCKALAQ